MKTLNGISFKEARKEVEEATKKKSYAAVSSGKSTAATMESGSAGSKPTPKGPQCACGFSAIQAEALALIKELREELREIRALKQSFVKDQGKLGEVNTKGNIIKGMIVSRVERASHQAGFCNLEEACETDPG